MAETVTVYTPQEMKAWISYFGFTYQSFAEFAGVSKSAVSMASNGKPEIGYDTKIKISKAIDRKKAEIKKETGKPVVIG